MTHFYILTGGPGVGKTAVLNELASCGYATVPEIARAIIKEQLATGGGALPWKNKEHYLEQMFLKSVESYTHALTKNAQPLFFDRGLPDAFCYATLIGKPLSAEMEAAARTCRYAPKVFIFPPWQEIYETDSERKQDWKEAEATFELMKKTYGYYGYEVIEVPKDTIANRKDFILRHVFGSKEK